MHSSMKGFIFDCLDSQDIFPASTVSLAYPSWKPWKPVPKNGTRRKWSWERNEMRWGLMLSGQIQEIFYPERGQIMWTLKSITVMIKTEGPMVLAYYIVCFWLNLTLQQHIVLFFQKPLINNLLPNIKVNNVNKRNKDSSTLC